MSHLDWEGGHNVRALWGTAFVRAGTLDRKTPRGWAAAAAYGIRTVIDLRHPDEYSPEPSGAPAEMARVRLPLDQKHDREFWDLWESGLQFGTPLYYGPHLERFPDASARVIRAIAHAAPGGVVFHCGAGRDRTGQIAMLVLALLGASHEQIGAEYVLSYGRNPDDPMLQQHLTSLGTTAAAEIARILSTIDVRALVTDADIAALTARASL
jgi:protein tyrosine/serine phosphatase